MYSRRSPPQQKKTSMGGSSDTSLNNSNSSGSLSSCSVSSGASTTVSRSALSSQYLPQAACSSTLNLLADVERSTSNYQHSHLSLGHHQHQHLHHYNHHHQHHHGSTLLSSSSHKRAGSKHNWGNRKRAGMSFLIVIAFFAIFGLIILTEVFMIDDVSHHGMLHGGIYSSRLGDSLPDYEVGKLDDDYLVSEEFLLDKASYAHRDKKSSANDKLNLASGRWVGMLGSSKGAGGLSGNDVAKAGVVSKGMAGAITSPLQSFIPWGRMLSTKDELTLPPYPSGMTATDASWQVVNGTRFKFFIFSAYYDRRDGARLVRVVGATKTRAPERVWCRFWFTNRNTSNADGAPRHSSATVMARVKIIRENWNLKYSACFILCPVHNDVPQEVSIVARLRTPSGNLLQLRNTDWDPDFSARRVNLSASLLNPPTNTKLSAGAAIPSVASVSANTMPISAPPTSDELPDKIAVCVKPIHFEYDQSLYLMEYMELYSLMGVSHFTFYNHTIGPHASCVLQHYMSGDVPGNLTAWDELILHGQSQSDELPPNVRYTSPNYEKPTVNILPWNLRMRSQKEIRTEGLFAALNDCLYRNMYRYKYVALVDLDEFIVPGHNDTLIDLLNFLNRRVRQRNTGAYSFHNAFFYLQFPDDTLVYKSGTSNVDETRLRAALVTQRKTKRRYKLHPQKQRSKYICKPEAIVEAGNHFVWEFASGKVTQNVPPTDAILQHYRVCEFGGNDCIKAPSIVDRTATKYGNRLVQRIQLVYNHLKKRCHLPDLPELPKQVLADMQKPVVTRAQQKPKHNDTQATHRAQRNATVAAEANNSFSKQIARHEVLVGLKANISSIKTITTTNLTVLINERVSGKGKPTNATATMLTNATAATTINTTTTTTTTIKPTTRKNEVLNSAAGLKSSPKRRHKYVVFQQDVNGMPMAKVVYER